MPEEGLKQYAEGRVKTEEAKKKYYGEYPADKTERAKYDRGEDYKGADGKIHSPRKRRKKGPLQTEVTTKAISQPDERVGIEEKVEARRTEKKVEGVSRPASKNNVERKNRGQDYRGVDNKIYSQQDDNTWVGEPMHFVDTAEFRKRGQRTFGINLSKEAREKKINELKAKGEWEWNFK